MLAGIIRSLTGEINTDYLHGCIAYEKEFADIMEKTRESLSYKNA